MAVSSADKKKLGKWIKQAREKKQPHLSQRQLALVAFPQEQILRRI